MRVLKTYINGEVVAEEGRSLIEKKSSKIINNFNIKQKTIDQFMLPLRTSKINVIEAIDGQVITSSIIAAPRVENGYIISDVQRDIFKIAVVNRYRESKSTVGFVRNFGLKEGAIASNKWLNISCLC